MFRDGSFKLFRFSGIQVSLHWSWLLVAAWQLDRRRDLYSSPVWLVAEYLGLFAIVLLHEFGHALACRQTGGRAEQILLWPFGGIAFVAPPPRAGAYLWSIAAGPLVNVGLLPVFKVGLWVAGAAGLGTAWPELMDLIYTLGLINLYLLIFNVLPIYPLDGGQILRGLLWMGVGPIRSQKYAALVGLALGSLLVLWAISRGSLWMIALSAYLLSQAWGAFREARRFAP